MRWLALGALLLLAGSAVQAQPSPGIRAVLERGLPFGLDTINWTMKAVPGAHPRESWQWPGTGGSGWGTPVILQPYVWKSCYLQAAFWFNSEGEDTSGGEIGNVMLGSQGAPSPACVAQLRAELAAQLGEPQEGGFTPTDTDFHELGWSSAAARRAEAVFDSPLCDRIISRCLTEKRVSRDLDARISYSLQNLSVVLWRPGKSRYPVPGAVRPE